MNGIEAVGLHAFRVNALVAMLFWLKDGYRGSGGTFKYSYSLRTAISIH
jgi:hypothetical protein